MAPEAGGPDLVTPSEAVQVALQWHREGRLGEAQILYGRILAADPDNPEALHFLGLLRHQLGAPAEGLDYVRQAIEAAPEYAAAHSNLGNMLLEAEDWEGAERAYRRALELEPDLTDARNNLGLLLRRLNRPDAAEEAFRELIERAPDHPLAYSNLGHLLFEMDRLDEACALLERAVALDPDFAEGFHNLGHVLAARHEPEVAAQAYGRAVALGADAYLELATALREQGLIDEAIAAYRRVLRIGGKAATAFYSLGMLLSAGGRDAEADEVYRQWLQEEPDNPVAQHMLEACRREAGPPRASDAYVQAIFDGFAPRFDQRLRELQYRAPDLVARQVGCALGSEAQLKLLDAGCGTGLCGPLLRPYASRLIGVDLSGPMLEQAAARGDYDELIHAELTAYLATCEERFDLIVSADTLVYFGDLVPVISAAARALVPGGLLVATVERSDHELPAGYRLNGHGRYSHAESYLRRVLKAAGFEVLSLEAEVLRQEMAQPVAGILFSATKGRH